MDMCLKSYLMWILTVSLCPRTTYTQNFSDTVNLYTNLLSGYNNKIRPVSNYSNPITVGMDFYLVTFKEFNEVTGVFSVVSALDLTWNDHRLTWDPASYGNITSITFEIDQIWKPYLVNTKQITQFDALGTANSILRVFSSGLVLWQPPGIFDASCAVDVTHFPFDKQNCSLVYMPWGYTPTEVIIQPVSNQVSLLRYTENGFWDIAETKIWSKYHSGAQLIFIDITFKRNPVFYVANMLLPILVIEILNVAVFRLPAESGERISYATMALLSIIMYISSFSAELPRTNQPNIALFSYLLLIYLTISSLIVLSTICSLTYYNKSDKEQLPQWARALVKLGRVCVCNRKRNGVTSVAEKQAHTTDHDYDVNTKEKFPHVVKDAFIGSDITWRQFANILDTFFCIIYLFSIVCANTVFFAAVMR